MRALRLPSVTPPDTAATPWVPGVRRVAATAVGIVDLVAGAMLLALASGLGVVAPVVIGGFGTAIVVGATGALTLGMARTLERPGIVGDSLVSLARLASVVGHALVLASSTGIVVVIVAAVLSLILSIMLLVAVWVPWVIAWRSRPWT